MPTILLIEDDAQLLRLYTKLLKHEGYRVIASATFHLVPKLVKRQQFDLIISDLELGLIHPPTVIRTFSEVYRQHQMPILLISAHMDKYQAMIENYGLSHTLAKPFSNHEFIQQVKNLLQADDEEETRPSPPRFLKESNTISYEAGDYSSLSDGS